jgi:hypothetical protein
MLKIDVELSPAFELFRLSSPLSVELEEGEATVKSLLHRLGRMGGERGKSLLFEKGEDSVLSGLMVMVNNRIFTGTAINQEVVELHDRDKVSLLYFVSGG